MSDKSALAAEIRAVMLSDLKASGARSAVEAYQAVCHSCRTLLDELHHVSVQPDPIDKHRVTIVVEGPSISAELPMTFAGRTAVD